MQRRKVEPKRAGNFFAVLVVLGMLLCGCSERGTDAYFFEDAQVCAEEKTAEAVGQEAVSAADSDAAENGMKEAAAAEEESPDGAEEDAVCIVHICGAVRAPGVYELPAGSRVMDAVAAGGGFLEDADQAACNLAQPVVDGCQIYIMTKEESSSLEEPAKSAGIQQPEGSAVSGEAAVGSVAASETGDGKVNINTADASALTSLPGIGDSRAAAIIAYRQEHGGFHCIEDIMKVSGIKQAAFEKIKDRIAV